MFTNICTLVLAYYDQFNSKICASCLIFLIDVNQTCFSFLKKTFATACYRVLVVTEHIISGTQCDFKVT